MTQRARYRRFLSGPPGVPIPNIDLGPLMTAYERWLTEGLPPALDPREYDPWCDAFGLDRFPTRVAISTPRPPLYEEIVLEETETTITKRLSDGSIQQDNKGWHKTIPHELRPAITSYAEWERMRDWLDADGALPDPDDPNVAATLTLARESAYPVALAAGSLIGMVRNWLGFENFCLTCYDDLAWITEMVEVSCRLAERQVRYFGEQGVPLDRIHFWEDICYKNGPIISPHHFTEIVVPRYRRVADLAAQYGDTRLSVDSDGNLDALLDGWLAGGVTILCPLEVQAGMDVNVLQQQHPGVFWYGGIHKYRLTGGEAAIAAELERLRPAVERGRYLPMLDHNVPPDVSYENYLTYLRLRHEILGLGQGAPDPAVVRAG